MDIIVNKNILKRSDECHRLCIGDMVIEFKILPAAPKKTNSLFDEALEALPEVFSSDELAAELGKRELRTPPRQLIYEWVRDNMVKKIGHRKFRKIA